MESGRGNIISVALSFSPRDPQLYCLFVHAPGRQDALVAATPIGVALDGAITAAHHTTRSLAATQAIHSCPAAEADRVQALRRR